MVAVAAAVVAFGNLENDVVVVALTVVVMIIAIDPIPLISISFVQCVPLNQHSFVEAAPTYNFLVVFRDDRLLFA